MDAGWPSPLGEQGFTRHLLEATVQSSDGTIRADAIAYRCDPDLVLLAECKSGKNLEEEQARRYLTADAIALRRAGTLPAPFTKRDGVTVAAMFVGLEDHRAELESALNHLGINAPLLTIGRDRARLSGASGVSGLDDFDIPIHHGLPPARVPIDHQSPDDEVKELVIPKLVAAAARREDYVEVEQVCRDLLPEWAILSQGGRRDFVRQVEQILRGAAASDLKRSYRFEPQSQEIGARAVILGSPASFDSRGATQAWQAQQRKAAKALGRSRAPAIEGQLSLEDLAEGGGLATE